MNAPVRGATFHAGERALQRAAGVEAQMAEHGALLVRAQMPDQHRALFQQLPVVLIGGLAADGQPWATLWSGAPGFVSSPDPGTLRFTPSVADGDPLAASWRPGAPIAVLGLEAHTRRRNRANGRVRQNTADGLEVAIQQSFGNCPKYIVPRRAAWQLAPSVDDPAVATGVRTLSARLDAAALALIAQADTFFIASSTPDAGDADAPRACGVDVSHRAGPPGFVRVAVAGGSAARSGLDDSDRPGGLDGEAAAVALCIPDYAGNRMFNTFGNLLLEPRAGLLFIDYATGDLLWLSGIARIDQDAKAVAAIPGAQRLLRIQLTGGIAGKAPTGLRWQPV